MLKIPHLQHFIQLIGLGLLLNYLPFAQAVTNCAMTEIPPVECEVLLDLYNSTDGSNWIDNSGWNETNEPCDWYGVSCNDGHVTKISLPYNQLSGSIPESLENLSNFQLLQLQNNQLSGSIPESLGNLSNSFDYLHLYGNQLSGSIPESLGNLINLRFLILSYNQLCGNIPLSFMNLNKLASIRLESNHLTVSDPALIDWLESKSSSGWDLFQTPPFECSKTLTIIKQGEGRGNVISHDRLRTFRCGPSCQEASNDYETDQEITLTVHPSKGFLFTGWSGDCDGTNKRMTVTLDADKICTVNFEVDPSKTHQLSVSLSEPDEGKITSEYINCGNDCEDIYLEGQQVWLRATPNETTPTTHYAFVEWSGDCSGTKRFTSVLMNGEKNCTAHFKATPKYKLTIEKIGMGSGIVTRGNKINCGANCSHYFKSGQKSWLKAIPNADSFFIGWSGDCNGTRKNTQVTLTEDMTCVANFEIE